MVIFINYWNFSNAYFSQQNCPSMIALQQGFIYGIPELFNFKLLQLISCPKSYHLTIFINFTAECWETAQGVQFMRWLMYAMSWATRCGKGWSVVRRSVGRWCAWQPCALLHHLIWGKSWGLGSCLVFFRKSLGHAPISLCSSCRQSSASEIRLRSHFFFSLSHKLFNLY